MKALFFLIIAVILLPLMASAQGDKIVEKLYFGVDEHVFTSGHRKQVDALVSKLDTTKILTISIEAHTDSSASDAYNVGLSKRRAESVKGYLKDTHLARFLDAVAWKGENQPAADNGTDVGKQQNRRVVVTVILKKEEPALTVDAPVEAKPDKDDCKGDTTLVLPQGTEIIVNKCKWREKKDCYSFKEFNTPESASEAGLTTQTEGGAPLFSCGMIQFSTCDGECADFPITVRFPVRPCMETNGVTLWNGAPGGTWTPEDAKKREVEIVEVKGEQYYQFQVICPGMTNCDKKLPLTPKYRFKAKGSILLTKVKVGAKCPTAMYAALPKKGKAKRKLKTRMPCSLRGMEIYAEAIDKKTGDTLVMQFKSAATVESRAHWGRCIKLFKRPKFFMGRGGDPQRKYLFRRKDFEIKKEVILAR